ncbi:MAG TPA: NAD(P)-dependent oxidoreductase [Hellea balneolensis]|uniref:NAD(P)-dependent oxidoreductase n=1 Tax=Hellea balneolensis TaxID=287478 RepID=A0A7C5M0M0_9PROT|nr:NAD(P)-dependent oxidoreductase [Hellea balneolensis]
MSGGSRGIGLAIALKAARDGANIAIAAKTAEPHPKLPGTIYTAAKEIEQAGGQALPLICDIRDDQQVQNAIDKTVQTFGGIDICINNASAISMTGTDATSMKRYDLMNSVNARGTFLLSKLCLPYLKNSEHAHILNLSPPLDMSPKWFKNHTAYTMAKYGMSMCTLGMAEEFKPLKIAVNSLWPLTAINTAAVRNVLGGDQMAKMSRTPEILADCAHIILCKDPVGFTGHFVIDEELMRAEGIEDFSGYAPGYDGPLVADFFVPDHVFEALPTKVMRGY